jgi:uncharacterized protein (TIGR02145 family)/uncharacterized repeat protein (TIGR02543 family)
MYTQNPLRAPQFSVVKNHRCFYFFIAMLCLLIFYCGDLPTDPRNSSNSDVLLLLISSSGKVDEKVVNDTVGKTITIRVKMAFPQFIKSTHLEIFSENNVSEFDTSLVSLSKESRDSIDIERLLTSDGQKTIIVKSLIDDGTFRGDTAILLVAKQSAINHKPKLTITGIKPIITIEEACSLKVTVDDTDLNQSHTTTVSYKSKTDTVKNSLYILKSSVAEIDTLVFVTKDNGVSPLSDTLKVIITVITKGTPAAPQWDTDTLDVKIKSGSVYTLNLKDTCYDPNGDTLSFVIIPNPQVTGAISGTTYSFTPSVADTGTKAVSIVAKDPGNLSDTMTIRFTITCDSMMNDTVKPSITLQTPEKDSSSVSASTVTVTVKCTDDNGIAAVIGVIESREILFVNSIGDNFTATVSGLAVGLNSLKITATDASANTNKATKTYTINYDPTMDDNVGPVFTKISGPASGTVVIDPAVTLVYSITDTNKVDSVYWTLNGTRIADLKAGTGDQYTINFTLPKAHENIIVINAQDGSTKRNKNSITITLDYTKRFTLTTSISAGVSGTITQTPAGTEIDSNTTVQLTAPSDLKYDFTGWTGDVTDTAHTIKLVMNGNKTVTANYTFKNFTVKFNSQGGSNVDDQPVAYGGKVSSPTKPDRTGYTFVDWYKDTACSNVWTFTTDIVTSDTTLFAKWTANVYTVTFDGNGATVASNPTTKNVTFPATTIGPLPTDPQRDNFRFDGWYTGTNGTGTAFTGSTTVTQLMTVYAKWTPVFTVTYNANGGAGAVPVDTNKYQNSQTVSVLGAGSLSRTNYTFAGWNTQADTLGTNYGLTFPMGSANVVLYAKWRMNVPVVTTQPTSKTCPVNDSVTFTVAASGANLSYQWQKNSVNIEDATMASYTPPALTVDDTAGVATYLCVVSNAEGSATSNGATLSISTLTDADGNIYHQVKIGNQIWTMKNLRVTKYNDGKAIGLITENSVWSSSVAGYCFYNNSTNSEENKKWGALYNWYVVSTGKLAPQGWHVPSDTDWTALTNYLIANGYNYDSTTSGNNLANSMAATTDWPYTGLAGTPGGNASTNNRSGFSALPGGYRSNSGGFDYRGENGLWWSSSEKSVETAGIRTIWYISSGLFEESFSKDYGSSVRLVKD